jgi:hypothetical protein
MGGITRAIWSPFRLFAEETTVPRVETWVETWVETLGFYEADDFVKTRWKIFSFIFDSFWPTSDDTPPVRLWCLIFAV